MSRTRLASAFTFLWSVIQAWTLLLIGFYPWDRPIGWALCAVVLVISAGLWGEKPWARLSFLILGSGLTLFYAAGYLLGATPCMRDTSGCNLLLVVSQPALTIAALAVVLKPLASNPAVKRDAPQAARPLP